MSATARYFGVAVKRKEDFRLLTGKANFVDDLKLPGIVHAVLANAIEAALFAFWGAGQGGSVNSRSDLADCSWRSFVGATYQWRTDGKDCC